ncbi:leucyl/phenylalanyl-tRNA--protein transferase [Lewinellaceae bacterium SD302]|nr:leucyl/phenylalanyl-tRNA--protein transferase [Lewinellaceae bacterium SD302]
MALFQLNPEDPFSFPLPELVEKDEPACIGGDLSSERLITAYQFGYFPWFSPGSPLLWWNPDPRFVIFPEELKVAKSMRPYFNQKKYRVTYDTAFEEVIKNCRDTYREGQLGSWIDQRIITAYQELHRLGFAHSVEVWDQEDSLVGGLYGIAIGKVFFGESMFAHARDASKFGFISLVRRLKDQGYELIDCQQRTSHLASLGGRAISRNDFTKILEKITPETTERGPWTVH